MSQRESGYERKERDLYETPEWVTKALWPHHFLSKYVWEPAAGNGAMARALCLASEVSVSDIELGPCPDWATRVDATDFLACHQMPKAKRGDIDAIITNPPYELATEFCEHALRLMEPVGGRVAMLLRTDFDHAKSRTNLFRDCPAFAKKVVLMKRICWFVEADGKPKASPSFNHCWMIWDWKHEGPPTIAYAP